ncbi:Peptidyl-prolyl isomerase cwc27 [Eufriesea mexicana]|uniref:Peptidyl-prolyl isomerase cwc27 n=1 Tax=Eufriesea mexicana TaxID=516756 RepID=A0A310SE67_9HYME|nr:Peptidyl-prolyl isomerase cwc27 [Eufriesea mexicana]
MPDNSQKEIADEYQEEGSTTMTIFENVEEVNKCKSPTIELGAIRVSSVPLCCSKCKLLNSAQNCSLMRVELAEGMRADLSCKNTKQTVGAIYTRTNFVTLKYVTDSWGTASNGFRLVITAVKDPSEYISPRDNSSFLLCLLAKRLPAPSYLIRSGASFLGSAAFASFLRAIVQHTSALFRVNYKLNDLEYEVQKSQKSGLRSQNSGLRTQDPDVRTQVPGLSSTPNLQNKHAIFGRVTGESIYCMLKLEEALVDENDRPLYPPRLIRTIIINNPFSHIIPRITVQRKFSPDSIALCNEKFCYTDSNLLSFGGEAKEDEEESVKLNKTFTGEGKSAHAHLTGPKLRSQLAVEPSGLANKKRKEGCSSDWESDDEVQTQG